MKRKNDSDSDFIDSDDELDQPDLNTIFLILGHPDDHNVQPDVKKKKKKTKIDLQRDKILNEINKLNSNSTSLTDRVIFSNMPIAYKAQILSELEKTSSGSDKMKYSNYVEKVLQIPFGVVKKLDIQDSSSKFLLKLKKNLDDSIYGHQQTKEEIIDYVSSLIRNPSAKGNVLALQSDPGMGKCHAINTPILMYNGTIKMIQDIKIGDVMMGDDSTPRNVLNLGRGRAKMYKIKHMISKTHYTVNDEHILCLMDSEDNILEIPVKDFVELTLSLQHSYKGYSTSVNFTVNANTYLDSHSRGKEFDINSTKISNQYKVNSYEFRINFLSGFIENHGIYHEDCIEIILPTANKPLCEDLLFLIRSLGYIAYSKDFFDGKVTLVTIKGQNLLYIKHPKLYKPFISKEPILIEALEEDSYYGVTLDGNSRYVLGNMTVTHNTKFARALGSSLGLPFYQISFGGMNDPSVLLGHEYTYIGSKPGRIYDAITQSKCMNPIIFFDEIEKASETKSTEINGILTHLLDKEQNMEFHDYYLGNISMDLSKVLFIVSFNNEHLVDPVVLNRLKVIRIKESTLDEKIQIVKNFTIKEICSNLSLDPDTFIISEEIIKYIITNKTKSEPGMRNINKNFETLIGKINTLMYMQGSSYKLGLIYDKIKLKMESGKILFTEELVDSLLHNSERIPEHLFFMYN